MPSQRLSFGPFSLDLPSGQLLREGRWVPLAARDLAVLRHLVVRGGQLVSTDEILESVWADTFVVRGVVKTSIHRLRTALGDSQARGAFIETVGRLGYRFAAEVRVEPVTRSLIDGLSLSRPEPRIEAPAPRPSELAAETPGQCPFVGRAKELDLLQRFLASIRSGSGRVALIVGEPGIGKTRLLEEFAPLARAFGARVLWGRSFEGELARPFGPLADAVAAYASETDGSSLRAELGEFGGILARIAPELRARMPGLDEPAPLPPQQERSRLFDALAQVFGTMARRGPLVLILDDLHWADAATLAALRHIARRLERQPMLVLGAYREQELERKHPLAETVAALRRDLPVDRLALEGLAPEAVAELLGATSPGESPPELVDALTAETAGNPLFVGELLRHLVEAGTLGAGQPRIGWRRAISETGVPDGVREVIGRRLARLSDEANRFLATASGSGGRLRFDCVAAVSGLDPPAALDALEAGLRAGLLRETSEPEIYEFTHALIRSALYTDMSEARRVRLHRRLAEELERRAAGADPPELEIARHYWRSASLPGAERGVPHALAAATHAEGQGALEESADALRIALQLMPLEDPRRPRATARLAIVLAWALKTREASALATDAAALLGSSEGAAAATQFLATLVSSWSFGRRTALELARQGLKWAGDDKDSNWGFLRSVELDWLDTENASYPGMTVDTPERREAWIHAQRSPLNRLGSWACFSSRREVLEAKPPSPFFLAEWAGEVQAGTQLLRDLLRDEQRSGRIAVAADNYCHLSRFLTALGELDASSVELARSAEIRERAGRRPTLFPHIAALELAYFRGEDIGRFAPAAELQLQSLAPQQRPYLAITRCNAALVFAAAGREDDAMREVTALMPAVERSGGGVDSYTPLLCWTAEVLWMLRRATFVEVLEHNLRTKTIEPDFRCIHVDARRAMAKLCALTDRLDEALVWFARAREVLDEQGARPLRALIDYDEAEVEVRRGALADRSHARELLDAARSRFESLGMHGWLSRAETLSEQLDHPAL